jgi:hypothetical protein
VTEYTYSVKDEIEIKGAKKVRFLGKDLRLYECPITYITRETWEIISLVFRMDDSKTLLHAGGWGDQPRWLIEALDIYKAEWAKKQEKPDGEGKS